MPVHFRIQKDAIVSSPLGEVGYVRAADPLVDDAGQGWMAAWQAVAGWQPAMSHRVSHTKVDALLTWLPALPPFSADLKAQGSSPQGMGRTGMACADNMLGRRG